MTTQNFEARRCIRCKATLPPNQVVCPLCGLKNPIMPSKDKIPISRPTIVQLGRERQIFATPPRIDFKPCRIVPGVFVLLILAGAFATTLSIVGYETNMAYYDNSVYIIVYMISPSIFYIIFHLISIIRIINKKVVMVKDLSFNAYLYFMPFTYVFMAMPLFYGDYFLPMILIGLSIGLLIAISALRIGPWLVPPSSWAEMNAVKSEKCKTIIYYLKELAKWRRANEYISIQDFARHYNFTSIYVISKLTELTRKRLLINASFFGLNAYFRFDRFGLNFMNAPSQETILEEKIVQVAKEAPEATLSLPETPSPLAIQPDIQGEVPSDISTSAVPPQPETIPNTCPHCGMDNSIVPDGQFCIACGKSLRLAPESILESSILEEPSTSPAEPLQPEIMPIPEPVTFVPQVKTPEPSIFDYTSRFGAVVLSAGFMKGSQEFYAGTSANTFICKDINKIAIDYGSIRTLPEKGLNVLCLTSGQAVFCTRGDVMKWASIHVIDPGTDKIMRTISSQQSAILAVAMSSNGDKLIAGGYDKLVELWDIESGDLVHSMKGHGGPIDAVALDPGMQFAVSGSRDKTLKVWSVATGDVIHTLEGHKGPVISIAVSSDGSRIASGSDDCTIRIWDASDGRIVHVLKDHTGSVTTLLISSDGHHLISGSRDTTAKVWNMDTGVLLKTIAKHAGTVKTLALSPDETCLVTGSADNTARCWPFNEYIEEKQAHEQETKQEIASNAT